MKQSNSALRCIFCSRYQSSHMAFSRHGGHAGRNAGENQSTAGGRAPSGFVKEAKNEKTVIWYAPMNREDLRQFTGGFEAEYPFLKVEDPDRRAAELAQSHPDRAPRRQRQLRYTEYSQLRALHAQESRRHRPL